MEIWSTVVKKTILANFIGALIIFCISCLYQNFPSIEGLQSVISILVAYTLYICVLLYEMKQYSTYLQQKNIVNGFNVLSILIGMGYLFGGISFLPRGKMLWIGMTSVLVLHLLRLVSIYWFNKCQDNSPVVNNTKVLYDTSRCVMLICLEFILMIVTTDNVMLVGLLSIIVILCLLKTTMRKRSIVLHTVVVLLLSILTMLGNSGFVKPFLFSFIIADMLKSEKK